MQNQPGGDLGAVQGGQGRAFGGGQDLQSNGLACAPHFPGAVHEGAALRSKAGQGKSVVAQQVFRIFQRAQVGRCTLQQGGKFAAAHEAGGGRGLAAHVDVAQHVALRIQRGGGRVGSHQHGPGAGGHQGQLGRAGQVAGQTGVAVVYTHVHLATPGQVQGIGQVWAHTAQHLPGRGQGRKLLGPALDFGQGRKILPVWRPELGVAT